MTTDPLTKLTKAKLLDLFMAENRGTASQHLDAKRWTKARLIHAIKQGREDRFEPTYSARALMASKAANHAWFDDIVTPYREINSEYLSALAKNYNALERQFAVPKRYWWERIPYFFGWLWRIPYGWWLAFVRYERLTRQRYYDEWD